MENALRKRLEILKGRAREIRRLYLERNGLVAAAETGIPRALAEVAPGEEVLAGASGFYLIRTETASIGPDAPEVAGAFSRIAATPVWRRLSLSPYGHRGDSLDLISARDFCFFDIETTGLTPSTYAFLCGMMTIRDGVFVIEQVLARDYAEEAAMLDYVRRMLARFSVLVTYNGACFDVPFIKTRMAVARMNYAGPPDHVDLLAPARRVFGNVLPNCRLETIERHLRGPRTAGADIPGSEIPEAYHEFVRTGDARRIGRILYHNRMDLFAMAGLFNRLLDQGRE